MFTLKHLKTLQHVSVLFRSSSGSSCSLLKLLILKFVKNEDVSGTHLHTERTYTHTKCYAAASPH